MCDLFKILISATLFLSHHAYATDRLQAYECDKMESCSGVCKLIDRQFSFFVDKKNSMVKADVYEGGVFARTMLFENCRAIFNEKNWNCKDEMFTSETAIIFERQMNNGIYFVDTTAYSKDSQKGLIIRRLARTCAK